ncbi:hypothetical protein RJ639_029444 [Escallonia herrerae]|uniref:Sm domain-containing protein n=1 Tax=Escallonia herrerae TaxID=1293975 RepID=A0AA88UVS5_9ASTE|nr:hypothetical protein RJ639_029444 [Escallonia herrerae]
MAVRSLGYEVADLCFGKPLLRSLSVSAIISDALVANYISAWSCDLLSSVKFDGTCRCIGRICMVDVTCFLCMEKNLSSSSSSSALKALVSALLSQLTAFSFSSYYCRLTILHVSLSQSGRKETVLDLAKFIDKGVQVKLAGGRQVIGFDVCGSCFGVNESPLIRRIGKEHLDWVTKEVEFYLRWGLGTTLARAKDFGLIFALSVTGMLKGYDQLLNLVLDEAVEFLRDADDPLKTTDQTRRLGLIVCRDKAVMLVSPTDGTEQIANPFIQPDGA